MSAEDSFEDLFAEAARVARVCERRAPSGEDLTRLRTRLNCIRYPDVTAEADWALLAAGRAVIAFPELPGAVRLLAAAVHLIREIRDRDAAASAVRDPEPAGDGDGAVEPVDLPGILESLPPVERRLLDALSRGELIDPATLPLGTDDKLFRSKVANLRRALAPHDIEIERERGVGYVLSARSLERIRAGASPACVEAAGEVEGRLAP